MRSRLLAVSLLAVLCWPGLAHAADSFRITVAAANVRREPSTAAAVIVTVARDTKLPVLGDAGQWVRVEVVDRIGIKTTGFVLGSLGILERQLVQAPPQLPAPDDVRTPAERPREVVAPTAGSSAPPSASASVRPEPAQSEVPQPALKPKTALTASAPPFRKREPLIALLLSGLFPGIGQFYNGPTEQRKGIFMAAGAGATYVLMFTGCSGNYYTGSDGGCGRAVAGMVGLLGLEIYSMYDAATRASALNRQHGLSVSILPERVAGRTGVRAQIQFTHQF